MAYSKSPNPAPTPPPPIASTTSNSPALSAKIVIAGGFGVGKTTLVAAISEIPPVNTEAWMTAASTPVDRLDPGIDKTTTTVAMDFGRRTLSNDLVLYLFGTPGQPRFLTMWDDLCRGAAGALVLVDSRRLADSFGAINYFEKDTELPFVVAVNPWNDIQAHPLPDIRNALALPEHVPLITCDARQQGSVTHALIAVVDHTLTRTAAARSHQPALVTR